jgi:hypothetical protein
MLFTSLKSTSREPGMARRFGAHLPSEEDAHFKIGFAENVRINDRRQLVWQEETTTRTELRIAFRRGGGPFSLRWLKRAYRPVTFT